MRKAIENLLKNLTSSSKENAKILIKGFEELGIQSFRYLFVLTDDLYDEELVLKAIYALLFEEHISPNLQDYLGLNFVQNAVFSQYSAETIIKMIEMASDDNLSTKLNINNKDIDGNSIMHSVVGGYNKGELCKIYKCLCEYGFDSSLKDNQGDSILDVLNYEQEVSRRFSDEDIKEFKEIYYEQLKNKNTFMASTIKKTVNDFLERSKIQKQKISEALSKLTGSTTEDAKIIQDILEELNIPLEDGFHTLVNDLHDERQCYLAIHTLLCLALDPNKVDPYKSNFLQYALQKGYSENFILKLIDELDSPGSLYIFDFNHEDAGKDSILHSAIYSANYSGKISTLYSKLIEKGFNSNHVDDRGRNIISAMNFRAIHISADVENEKDLERVKKIFYHQKRKIEASKASTSNELTEKKTPFEKQIPIEKLEKFGKILNNKNFISSPAIGRDREMKSLLISLAQDKKSPILVGEPGVGKTVIAEELAYRIKNGNVPSFLKDRIVLEVSPSSLIAGCMYVGMFEQTLKDLFNLCEKYNIILFIDEIHTMYGTGATDKKSIDMAAIVKNYLDRSEQKIIGTTTEDEYQKYFSHDALKRRFDKITIKEPEEEVLYTILDKVISDYCTKSKLDFVSKDIKHHIIETIISATDKSHRVYNDRVNNPDLAISIIDKAFAFAKINDSDTISCEHFIESFDYCDRLYNSATQNAIKELKTFTKKDNQTNCKILSIDFNKPKR